MNDSTSSRGVGFLGLLTILFIGLKLTKYINWSWFWVLSPILIPTIEISLLMIILLIIRMVLNIKE